ncbi:hypothetical protein SRB5_34260 [Streptomyces sp. RB5]|uniref:Uncharacterized protein n=1 Tax=Streptomyces smaragdinus TaxID=2585196 RepID=A0A7K0CJT3_9ACTN|nr:hypothetical protein [Streptomyces smaragdinus]
MHVPAHRRQHDGALAGLVGLLHVRLQIGHRVLHHLGRLQHERQLHLPRTEQLTHGLHTVQQRLVDDVQGRTVGESGVEIGLEAVLLAVDDAGLEPLLQRKGGELLGLRGAQGFGGGALEEFQQALEGVVALAAAVVDQVEGGGDLLLVEPGDREDLRRVHDRRVQAGLHALVEEHRVQHDAGGRVQTEGDVRQTQGRLHVGMAALELADRLDRGDAVLARLLLTRTDREGQTVDQDVGLLHPPVPRQILDQPLGDGHLVLGRSRLALLVDRQRDQGGAVLDGQLRDLLEPGLRPVTVLVVHRVQDGPPAELLQPRPQNGRLRGVQHDRQRRGGSETTGQLLHVRDTVTAHVIHAQVEHVRALTDLLPRQLHAVVPARLQHRLTELLRPVRVRPLTDRQIRHILPERNVLVEGRRPRFGLRVALGGGGVADSLDQPAQVLGGGAAAAADQAQAVVADEGLLGVGEVLGAEGEVRAVLRQHRQARVRHAGQRGGRVAGEVAQVLAHLRRAGGTVQPDQIDAQRLEGGQRGPDLGAQQHRAGRLERQRADQGHVGAQGFHGTAGTQQGGLGLQQVLRGLDDQRVRAALEQALRVLLEAVADHLVRDVAERRQLGAGAHGAEHPALPAVTCGVRVGGLAGDPGTGRGQLVDAVGDLVLAHRGMVGAKGVRLDAVDTRGEVFVVHRAHDVGSGHVQDLVAALELLEVLQRRVLRLEHGAHRPVGDHHAGGERVPQGGGPVGGGGGGRVLRMRLRGHWRSSLGCDGCRLCVLA